MIAGGYAHALREPAPMRRLMNIAVPACTILAVLAVYFAHPEFIESIERTTYDFRFREVRGPLPPSSRIAIVAIDDRSIAELGRFPWSRSYFTSLVERATRAGATSLLLDVFFSEAESQEVDGAFARAVESSGITTLSAVFDMSSEGEAVSMTSNLPTLDAAARRVAHLNIMPDEDGVIRWTPLLIPYAGTEYPSLALAAAMDALKAEPGREEFAVVLGERRIPTDAYGRMLIDYTGPPGLYERFSFVDLAKGRVPEEALRGRILLVGATALGIYDMKVSPFSNNMPGIEINAAIADNILRGAFRTRGGAETLFDLAAIVLGGIAVSAITLRMRGAVALPMGIVLTVGYLALASFLFQRGHWVSYTYPVLTMVLAYSVTAYLKFFVLERKAREIRAMFSSFVSKKVVDALIERPELARVGGELRTITVLFADIRNYTSFSERHAPAEVVATLNAYLASMTEVIIEHDGTLDKFMGDGIMAFWGAPLDQPDQGERAVRCALAMIERFRGVHAGYVSSGVEPITFGIGIHRGEAIVGTIGVEGKKVEYTAIGDTVNTTYRVQNLSREIESPVITETLYQEVREIIFAERWGEVALKGKERPVAVYALKGMRS
jgi:adenylate cyclase